MNPSVIESLRENGYMAEHIHVVEVEHVQIVGARRDYEFTDYVAGTRRYMREATASVAVLEFTVDDPSPLAAKFSAALIRLLAPNDKLLRKHVRPLVRITETSTHFIYRTDTDYVEMTEGPGHHQLFQHGLAFPDAPQFSRVALRAACSNVLIDGTWLNDATPLTVKRDALPTWDRDATAVKLREFVDAAIADGSIRERGPYIPPQPRPQWHYGELDVSADPIDWDPADPRRNIPGVADEVRKLRKERGLTRAQG
jgi:hypothetical protein